MKVLWPLFAALFGVGVLITVGMAIWNKQPVDDDQDWGGA